MAQVSSRSKSTPRRRELEYEHKLAQQDGAIDGIEYHEPAQSCWGTAIIIIIELR
jgi:hypothetical protein